MSEASLTVRISGHLTPRQREVLRLLAQGKSTKQSAAELGISHKTVEFHRKLLMNRTELFSLPELTKLAVRIGLAEIDV